jgi:hypothetical protein
MLGARFGFILKVCAQLVRLGGLFVPSLLVVGFGVFLLRSRWITLFLDGSGGSRRPFRGWFRRGSTLRGRGGGSSKLSN